MNPHSLQACHNDGACQRSYRDFDSVFPISPNITNFRPNCSGGVFEKCSSSYQTLGNLWHLLLREVAQPVQWDFSGAMTIGVRTKFEEENIAIIVSASASTNKRSIIPEHTVLRI